MENHVKIKKFAVLIISNEQSSFLSHTATFYPILFQLRMHNVLIMNVNFLPITYHCINILSRATVKH